jgi:hypothetical protein
VKKVRSNCSLVDFEFTAFNISAEPIVMINSIRRNHPDISGGPGGANT